MKKAVRCEHPPLETGVRYKYCLCLYGIKADDLSRDLSKTRNLAPLES